MLTYEIQTLNENIRIEMRGAEQAYSWGRGHRSQWYTELRPLAELTLVWATYRMDGREEDLDALTELVPGLEGIDPEEDGQEFDGLIEDEIDRLVKSVREVAKRLAREVAEQQRATIPERLAEECYARVLDDEGDEIAGMEPSEAATYAYTLGITIEDQEGSKGIDTTGGVAVGWAIARDWDDRCVITYGD